MIIKVSPLRIALQFRSMMLNLFDELLTNSNQKSFKLEGNIISYVTLACKQSK